MSKANEILNNNKLKESLIDLMSKSSKAIMEVYENPERELDIKVKMECDDGEIHDFTLREVLFDKRYEKFSELSKTDENFFKSTHERRNPVMEDSDEDDYEDDKQEETV